MKPYHQQSMIRTTGRTMAGVITGTILGAAVGTLGGAVYGVLCGMLYGIVHGEIKAVIAVGLYGATAGVIAGALTGGFGRMICGCDLSDMDTVPPPEPAEQPLEKDVSKELMAIPEALLARQQFLAGLRLGNHSQQQGISRSWKDPLGQDGPNLLG